MTYNEPDDLEECKGCEKLFDESDAEDFEQFCSCECESESKQCAQDELFDHMKTVGFYNGY